MKKKIKLILYNLIWYKQQQQKNREKRSNEYLVRFDTNTVESIDLGNESRARF